MRVAGQVIEDKFGLLANAYAPRDDIDAGIVISQRPAPLKA